MSNTAILSLNQWRETGTWVDFDGQRIFVTVQGDGPPLLVLHGFPTASYDYARLAPLLSSHYRLILFDCLGFGFSGKPVTHHYSLFEQADIAQAVCKHYGVEQVSILTHDMGNSITLELLRRGNPVGDRVFMLNGSVLLKYYRPLITQRLLLNPVIGPLMTRLRLVNRRAFGQQFGSLFAQRPPDAEMDDFWALINHHDGARIYHRLIRYLNERKVHEYAWLDALQTHSAPLTVIWGQQDPVSVPQIAQAVLERRPDAAYFPLENIGHYPQWEAAEQVAEILLNQQ